MTVSVYAITSSPRVPRFTGLRGEPLRGVRIGRLTAVVGNAPRAPSANAANLRRYHDAIDAIAGRLPAILPVRFGTLMTEAELADILRSRAAVLSDALRHVRGRVQMIHRMPVAPARTPGAPAVAASRGGHGPVHPARHATGAGYLRARAAEAASARDVPELAPVRAAVARWIRDEQVERRGRVVSVYHLVPRAAADAYARAARTAASAAGVRVVISGPYPPYAFATL